MHTHARGHTHTQTHTLSLPPLTQVHNEEKFLSFAVLPKEPVPWKARCYFSTACNFYRPLKGTFRGCWGPSNHRGQALSLKARAISTFQAGGGELSADPEKLDSFPVQHSEKRRRGGPQSLCCSKTQAYWPTMKSSQQWRVNF